MYCIFPTVTRGVDLTDSHLVPLLGEKGVNSLAGSRNSTICYLATLEPKKMLRISAERASARLPLCCKHLHPGGSAHTAGLRWPYFLSTCIQLATFQLPVQHQCQRATDHPKKGDGIIFKTPKSVINANWTFP